MIRLSKPVKVLEWGEGTNTTNQIWSEMGEGTIASATQKNGLTSLVINMKSRVAKKNAKDNSVKIVQLGEGMTARSPYWGEVALGQIKANDGQSLTIEIPTATKIDKRRNVPDHGLD